MRFRLILLSALFLPVFAHAQARTVLPQTAAYCLNGTSWIPMAALSTGGPAFSSLPATAIYGQNGSTLYPVQCDVNGNLTGTFAFVTTAPSGACSAGATPQITSVGGAVSTCQNGVWTQLAAGGTGVSSITWALPSFMSASPATISSAGSQTFSFTSQTANTFLSSPNGSAGAPTFRAIVAADLPSFNSAAAGIVPASGGGTSNYLRADGTWQTPAGGGTPGGTSGQIQYNNAGAFGGVTAVAIANGGTGATSAATAVTNLGLQPYGTLTNGNYCVYTTGTGIVCNSAGAGGAALSSPTVNAVPKVSSVTGNGTMVNSSISDNGTQVSITEPLALGSTPPTACGSLSGCVATSEGASAGTPTAGVDYIRADSTQHRYLASMNGGSELALAQVVASGTAAMGTSAINLGNCSTVVTVAATGVATTDTIQYTPNGDPTSTTGYSPSSSGSLYIWAYPTSGNVNFKVCNNTSASITPGALTLNWKVTR